MMLPVDDDDGDNDELLWVKAGEPGEKPTIIRQIRSESSTSSSSRDNSGGSGIQKKNLLSVENGTVYRNVEHSCENIDFLEKDFLEKGLAQRTSSSDSRVIVVTINDQVYPANLDKSRIQRWRQMHSPNVNKKPSSKNETADISSSTRPKSQPTKHINELKTSPAIKRCASAEPTSNAQSHLRVMKSRDEGYTSLNEDAKDSDTDSIRSRSLPSSWKPVKTAGNECDLHKYATRMTSNNSTNADLEQQLKETSQLVNEDEKKDETYKKRRYKFENIIETCTCFICLRSVVYHTQDEDETDSMVDHPCSCGDSVSTKCCGRWTMITVMAIFLPLLIFYPPLKLCLNIHDKRKRKKLLKKEQEKVKKKNNHEEKRKLKDDDTNFI